MNALIVQAHPNPDSFVSHLADRVRSGLDRAGHDHRTIDLYASGFHPVMSEHEWQLHRAPATEKPWVTEHQNHLQWADTIVWVYPTWWSGPPAMLKGWVDRVWTNGVAYIHTETGLVPGPLKHINQMTIVTTHGASRWINMLEGDVGKKMIRRTLRGLCGLRCRTSWIAMYSLDTSNDGRRKKFADSVEERFAR